MASSAASELLGTRDGFLRYFCWEREKPLPVAVVPHDREKETGGLAASDEATIELAREQAQRLQGELGDTYHFYVGIEGGVHSIEIAGNVHHFVRSWAVITGLMGETWGSSGSIEIPQRLVSGLDDHQVPHAVPGTRRRGGMIASLTGGHETRRSAVRMAVFHCLSTLFYGVVDRPPSGPSRY